MCSSSEQRTLCLCRISFVQIPSATRSRLNDRYISVLCDQMRQLEENSRSSAMSDAVLSSA